jgi:hypothetical protein
MAGDDSRRQKLFRSRRRPPDVRRCGQEAVRREDNGAAVSHRHAPGGGPEDHTQACHRRGEPLRYRDDGARVRVQRLLLRGDGLGDGDGY